MSFPQKGAPVGIHAGTNDPPMLAAMHITHSRERVDCKVGRPPPD
jgi:hypothetical protein